MAFALPAPFLSAYDPVSEAEGSIDPLGLAGTYERLADSMLPGITVRMRRPRFLTALAVGAHVCADFEPEQRAKDGITPPYLVFEWWVLEAFGRARDLLAEKGRIPGIQKAQNAIRNGRPLSAPAYLQVPSVFGFTGIFRRLARHTRILTRNARRRGPPACRDLGPGTRARWLSLRPRGRGRSAAQQPAKGGGRWAS